MSEKVMGRRLGVIALSAVLFTALEAGAAQHPEHTYLGMEPTRVRTFDRSMQNFLQQQQGWQNFVQGVGQNWSARFDEKTRTPHRMWGQGIDLGKLKHADDVEREIMGFIADHAELLGVQDADLVMRTANYVAEMDAWYVDVDVLIDGLPTYRSGLTFRIKFDKLVMVGADTYPNAPITGSLNMTRAQGITQAMVQGPAPIAHHTDVEAEPMLLPIEEGGRVELRVTWKVKSKTEHPEGHWVSFVDAETGELLNVHNEIRYFTGEVLARHDTRLGNGALETSVLPYARMTGGGGADYTDASGSYDLPNTGTYTLSLNGSRLNVIDNLGTVSPTFPSAASVTVDAGDFNNRQAALSTYVWTHRAMDWGVRYAPEVSWSNGPARAYVNLNGSCNASWDGDLNFLQAGGGCSNSGRQSDVIVHEWGHGFHYYSIQAGDFDGSVSEGASDALANLISGDSRVAPYFYSSGGTLRNTDNNNRYPDNYINNDVYVHTNGLIFGGSIWDTWQALKQRHTRPGGLRHRLRALRRHPQGRTRHRVLLRRSHLRRRRRRKPVQRHAEHLRHLRGLRRPRTGPRLGLQHRHRPRAAHPHRRRSQPALDHEPHLRPRQLQRIRARARGRKPALASRGHHAVHRHPRHGAG